VKSFLKSLLNLSRKKNKSRLREAFRANLRLESLERRDNPSGISYLPDAHAVNIEGTSGSDTVYISIDTHGDKDASNDTLICKLQHGNVIEQQSFALYKSGVGGPVRQIDVVQFEGEGGNDKVIDTGDLSLVVFGTNLRAGEDQQLINFWTNTGKLAMSGTSQADTATATSNLLALNATIRTGTKTLSVSKLHTHIVNGVVTPIVKGLEFEGHDGNDTFKNYTSLNSAAYGGQGSDVLYGGYGDDLLEGDKDHAGANYPLTGDKDYLYGREGNDSLRGGHGDDYLDGGAGDDLMIGDAGNDKLTGFQGNDKMYGDEGDDKLYGDVGDDYLDGGAGNDYVFGMSGNDLMDGGKGNDYVDGGADMDNIEDNYGNNEVHGGAGSDKIFVGMHTVGPNTDVNYVYGEGGNDTIHTLGGTSWLHGGDGHDHLFGAAEGGNDHLFGEGGDDELFAGKVGAWLDGGTGDDWLVGGDGADLVMGGAGRDLLFGGLGGDVLDGGADNDIVIGGSCSGGQAADHVHDWVSGGTGFDRFQRDDDGLGGNLDKPLDLAAGELVQSSIAWGQWFTDVNFQGKGKPVS
jgi:Ca2+-binding RTX toxin-like protein